MGTGGVLRFRGMHPRDLDLTALLERWGQGDGTALAELVPLVYADLRRLAGQSLRGERADHTLQPTALVHEAYMRLAGARPPEVSGRQHFLHLAARLMRQILVDHARRQQAERRGARPPRVSLDEARDVGEAPAIDLLALDGALTDLAALDPRKAKVIELRFFGGFDVAEVAGLLGVSAPTVIADTRFARAFILARIAGP